MSRNSRVALRESASRHPVQVSWHSQQDNVLASHAAPQEGARGERYGPPGGGAEQRLDPRRVVARPASADHLGAFSCPAHSRRSGCTMPALRAAFPWSMSPSRSADPRSPSEPGNPGRSRRPRRPSASSPPCSASRSAPCSRPSSAVTMKPRNTGLGHEVAVCQEPAVHRFPQTGQTIRSAQIEGEPWFIAVDVAAILGLGNGRSSLALLDEDERGSTLWTPLAARSSSRSSASPACTR